MKQISTLFKGGLFAGASFLLTANLIAQSAFPPVSLPKTNGNSTENMVKYADKFSDGNYRTVALTYHDYVGPYYEHQDSIRIVWRQQNGHYISVYDIGGQGFIINGMYDQVWQYQWNAGWLPAGYFEKIYNNNGRLIELNTVLWDGINWSYNSGYRYFYNNASKVINRTTVTWTGMAWDSLDRELYTYNVGGKTTRVDYEKYVANVWTDYREGLSVYDGQGNNTIYNFNAWNGASYDSLYRYLYTYNNSDSVTEFISQDYNVNVWDNDDRTVYVYNQAGDKDSVIFMDWTGAWDNTLLHLYSYFNNHMTSREVKAWSGAWDEYQVYSYQYGPDDLLETDIQFNWDGSMYEPFNRNIYYYGQYDELKEILEEQYNVSDFDTIGVYRLYYEYDATGVENETQINLNAYPNPFTQNVALSFESDKTQEFTLDIMDISGRVIYQRNGFVAPGQNMLLWNPEKDIPAGIYIYRLWLDGKPYSGKLLKN